MILDMNARTVDWAALRRPDTQTPAAQGLRERKKHQMRQQLTDTATEMFLERGFDAVRVSEIADACGVSEKTVFNYFPTKESLILDHPDATMAALRTGLADPRARPVQAVLRILSDELSALCSWLNAQTDRAEAVSRYRRFGALIQTTPSLRAYQRDMTDQLVAVAAGLLADRAGLSTTDPEPQIAATAVLGLWRIQFQSIGRYLDSTLTPARMQAAVTADVLRAARLLQTGLKKFAGRPGARPREQAPPARPGRKQVNRSAT